MILLNGTVHTLDAGKTVAEAVAIRGDRIVAVGSTEEMRKSYSAGRIIDLRGKTVLPGLIDGHGHVLSEGSLLSEIDLVGTHSAAEVAGLVGARAEELRPGRWILGRGWDQNDWDVKAFPGHGMLDQAAPNNPVVLGRIDGHAVWVNKRVLDSAGITAETKDPQGGKIYRGPGGEPTGVLVDNAMRLVYGILPELTDAEVEERLSLALEECSRSGLTEVHDMGVDLRTIRAYKRLIDRGKCPVRVYAVIGGSGEAWNYYLREGPEIGYGGGLLTVRSVKLFIDGAMGSRGAAMIEEYSDDPGNRGLTTNSEENLEWVCRKALDKGFQVCTHAIGDRGNTIMLNVYEKALKALPAGAVSPRWRIEHAQVLLPGDIARFSRSGILPSMQPTHATSDMYWAESRLGPERLKGAYAWRSLLQTGSIIIGGSDFPVESVKPLWGFYAAVTRRDTSGYPEDGWMPWQKMTRDEAARCFSQWAAYGSFEENTKGTIEVGKWADLSVLSKDIMNIPPAEILTTDVEMTLVGGKVVFERPSSVAQRGP